MVVVVAGKLSFRTTDVVVETGALLYIILSMCRLCISMFVFACNWTDDVGLWRMAGKVNWAHERLLANCRNVVGAADDDAPKSSIAGNVAQSLCICTVHII